MSITVKDLFQYDPNFDKAKIQRLTGKKDYKKTDTVDLSRLAALNDKDLSIFAAKKEGKTFVNYIKDDNMRTQVSDAAGVKTDDKKENMSNANNVTNNSMDKSIFDIDKQEQKVSKQT